MLAQALVAGASGAHAGDLQAHLGWADVLVRIDGRSVTPDPEASFRRALEADPGNVYGHAMWASWMLRRDTRRSVEAMGHFDAALASGRDTPFVRSLQLGMMVTSQELGIGALRVLNQMRVKGETLDPAHKPRIWSYLYAGAYRQADSDRLTQAVPPQDALATFHWLFKRDDLDPSQHRLWRLVEGLLLSAAGKAEEARPILQALQQDLRASRSSGPIVARVEALLAKR